MNNWIKVKQQSEMMSEYNDCAVKAIACDVPYRVAHKALANEGRSKRKGSSMFWILSAVKKLGYKMEAVETDAKTITTLPRDKALGKGHYIAYVSRHVAAMVNGHVEDWSEGRRNRIITVYKVTPTATRRERKQAMKDLF